MQYWKKNSHETYNYLKRRGTKLDSESGVSGHSKNICEPEWGGALGYLF